jgi:hypothetical protein
MRFQKIKITLKSKRKIFIKVNLECCKIRNSTVDSSSNCRSILLGHRIQQMGLGPGSIHPKKIKIDDLIKVFNVRSI